MKKIMVDELKSVKVAAVYMRVSTSDQEEDGTIENQWIELKKRIADDGVKLPEANIYRDDGWSGAILERPELDRLRNDANEHKFDVLYLYDRGRLSRKLVHQEIVLDGLRKNNVSIVELHGISGDTPEAQMMGSMMGLFHEYERTKIAERMRLGKTRIVKENGELLGYQPCYGYDLHKTVKNGSVKQRAYFTVNEAEAKNVRYIFQLCADGNSLYKIRKRLKDEGIKAPRAVSGLWGNTTLIRMLKNTTYIGEHYYNKHVAIEAKYSRKKDKYSKVAKSSHKLKPQSEWWKVEVEPIVSRELFDKVQIQLTKNAKYNPRNNRKNKYLLTGLVRCSCGRMRAGDPATGGHLYYRCTDRLAPKLERECYSHGVNVAVLDKKVWVTICNLLTQPEMIDRYVKAIKKVKPEDTLLKSLNNRMIALENEKNRYIDGFGKGFITEEDFKMKMSQVRDERISTETKILELKRLTSELPQIDTTLIASNMVKLLKDGLTFEEKKELLRLVVEEIIATPSEATIKGKIPVFNKHCFNEKEVSFELENCDVKSKNKYFFDERKVGLNVESRNCWSTQCRQINFV